MREFIVHDIADRDAVKKGLDYIRGLYNKSTKRNI